MTEYADTKYSDIKYYDTKYSDIKYYDQIFGHQILRSNITTPNIRTPNIDIGKEKLYISSNWDALRASFHSFLLASKINICIFGYNNIVILLHSHLKHTFFSIFLGSIEF